MPPENAPALRHDDDVNGPLPESGRRYLRFLNSWFLNNESLQGTSQSKLFLQLNYDKFAKSLNLPPRHQDTKFKSLIYLCFSWCLGVLVAIKFGFYESINYDRLAKTGTYRGERGGLGGNLLNYTKVSPRPPRPPR
jgi:hypothetical protein